MDSMGISKSGEAASSLECQAILGKPNFSELTSWWALDMDFPFCAWCCLDQQRGRRALDNIVHCVPGIFGCPSPFGVSVRVIP